MPVKIGAFAPLLFFLSLKNAIASSKDVGRETFSIHRMGSPSRIVISIDHCFDEDKPKLFDENRSRLQGFAAALRSWKSRLGEKAPPHPPAIETTSTGTCIIDVTDHVPETVARIHMSKKNGPNCWNTALVLSQLVPALRYANSDEFWYWMTQSPLCRKLADHEPALAGDIVAVRWSWGLKRDHGESHGYVYIGNGLVFSKNGSDKTSPYEIQPEDQVQRLYYLKGNPECMRTEKYEPPQCTIYANYYRCQPFSAYLNANAGARSPDFDAHHSYLDSAECYIGKHIQTASSALYDPKILKLLNQGLDAVIAAGERKSSSAVVDGASKNTVMARQKAAQGDFLWKTLLYRAKSLKDQINDIQPSK